MKEDNNEKNRNEQSPPKNCRVRLLNGPAEKPYEELCKSIPERGEQCVKQATLLNEQCWAMARRGLRTEGRLQDARESPMRLKLTSNCVLGKQPFTIFAIFTPPARAIGRRPLNVERHLIPSYVSSVAQRAAKNREKKCPAR